LISGLFKELIDRRVVHAAAAYLATSLVILRLAATISRLFDLSEFFEQILALTLVVVFPFVMTWVWRYGGGRKARAQAAKAAAVEVEAYGDGATQDLKLDPQNMRNLMIVIGAVLSLAIVAMVVDRLLPRDEPERVRTTDATPARSIAVLPFVNMSADEEQEYFSDGLTEELLNLLAKIPELHVTSRTSAFAFKGKEVEIPEIARQLNVAHVLEGSVRKGGDQVRITAQLIEAEPDKHLWSETYDRSLEDVFAVQDEIATEVVQQLKIRLLTEMPGATPTDPEAYRLYLQGKAFRRLRTTESLAQALEALNAALEIDPEFAPAWVALGGVYVSMNRLDHHEENLQVARDHLEHALELDPSLAYAWSLLADISLHRFEFERAREDIEKALELGGDKGPALRSAGILAVAAGDLDGFYEAAKRVLAIDPLSLPANWNVGLAHYYRHEPKEALEYFDKVLVMSPGLAIAPFFRGLAMLEMGKPESALEVFKALEDDARRLQGTAMAYHDLGREAESAAAIDEMEERFLAEEWWSEAAKVRAYRGEADRAFELLEVAYENQHPSLVGITIHPLLDNLRADPRWPGLVEKATSVQQ